MTAKRDPFLEGIMNRAKEQPVEQNAAQPDKLCCLCASWIAADCLDDFEGKPCHKICKAEGVGRAHKPRAIAPMNSFTIAPTVAAPDVAGMVKRALRNEAAFHHLMSACQEALNHPHGLRMQDRELANALRYAISISHGESKTEEPRISALIEKLGQGWIPVSERLPEDDQTVIVWGVAHEPNQYAGWAVNWNEHDNHINDEWLARWKVTHWMPLPPPPERP